MNASHIFTVFAKELREILRDRRTLISMILVPTLVMPCLFAVVSVISLGVAKDAAASVPTVMILGGADSPVVNAALRAGAKVKVVPPAADWELQIANKQLRAAVEIPAGFDRALEGGEATTVRIYSYSGEIRSGFAVSEVRHFFDDYSKKIVIARLAERGMPPSTLKPFDVATQNVAPPQKVGGDILGGVIPLFLQIFCFIGAIYPAMDLTAGEKERGTMETILCSPVARLDLVLGKFLTILAASLGTVACSLVSMGLTFVVGGFFLAQTTAGVGGMAARHGAEGGASIIALDPVGLLAALAMVLPLAVLFSAGLFAVSLFAKSFKEAQSYVSPLILVIVLPAVVGVLPGVELNARLALVPMLNVCLVSKELVSGVWHWDYLLLIFGSTCVYAALAFGLAVRMFNREGVIFRA